MTRTHAAVWMKGNSAATRWYFKCVFLCSLAKQHTVFKWKDAISGFSVSQGSAETIDRWGGKTKHRLISYFLSNTSAKNYRNRIMYVKIIASQRWDVFWDTVYNGCRCLGGYSLRLHFLHLTQFLSDVLVLYISSTSAYRWRISLAEPVSVLRNVEIWPCWEQQRNSANEVSALPLRSPGTVFRNICARPPSPKTVSAWIENQRLPAGDYNLWEPCVEECIGLNRIGQKGVFSLSLITQIHSQFNTTGTRDISDVLRLTR